MDNIEKSAAQWQELVSEKDKEINKKDREIADLRKQVDWFKGQFKLLQSKQFGPSSEKSVELEEQLSLFNEPELFADPKAVEPDLAVLTNYPLPPPIWYNDRSRGMRKCS